MKTSLLILTITLSQHAHAQVLRWASDEHAHGYKVIAHEADESCLALSDSNVLTFDVGNANSLDLDEVEELNPFRAYLFKVSSYAVFNNELFESEPSSAFACLNKNQLLGPDEIFLEQDETTDFERKEGNLNETNTRRNSPAPRKVKPNEKINDSRSGITHAVDRTSASDASRDSSRAENRLETSVVSPDRERSNRGLQNIPHALQRNYTVVDSSYRHHEIREPSGERRWRRDDVPLQSSGSSANNGVQVERAALLHADRISQRRSENVVGSVDDDSRGVRPKPDGMRENNSAPWFAQGRYYCALIFLVLVLAVILYPRRKTRR